MKKIVMRIGGMSCQHCVHAVERALQGVAGVKKVQVDLAGSQAVLEIDENTFDWKTAEKAIIDQGYDYLGPVH